ncbi:MAG: thioredoxin family protein [Bacilli bacterium]|nr:thioredoxin family protein [Bacilli bacterium]
MKITVLGNNDKMTEKLYKNVQQAVKEMEMNVDVIYLTDIDEIVKRGILKTPALMVDERIVSAGQVLEASDVKRTLR